MFLYICVVTPPGLLESLAEEIHASDVLSCAPGLLDTSSVSFWILWGGSTHHTGAQCKNNFTSGQKHKNLNSLNPLGHFTIPPFKQKAGFWCLYLLRVLKSDHVPYTSHTTAACQTQGSVNYLAKDYYSHWTSSSPNCTLHTALHMITVLENCSLMWISVAYSTYETQSS